MSDMARETYPFLPGVTLILSHRFESLAKIARVRCPILIAHGRADTAIPFSMSQRLAAAAGDRATLMPVDGAEHALGALRSDGTYAPRRCALEESR
jgi:uncharacterized protein